MWNRDKAMTRDAVDISYRFHFSGGATTRIDLKFDGNSFALQADPVAAPAPWTALNYAKCGHCPLSTGSCPFAASISTLLLQFGTSISFENTVVEVVTKQRTCVAHGALQNGMASLVGLLGATSGCPHLAFFRPMAHFHLPFATEEETLVRAISSHLLERYMRGEPADLDDLRRRYEAAALVNVGMANRLRTAFAGDAVVNGLIILDTFAQAAPYVIRDSLEELRYIFDYPAG
jgi:hypothetical protein